MASLNLCLFIALIFFSLSHLVHCNDKEDRLFNGINSYRQSQNLSAFTQNSNAACLAHKLAKELDDRGETCSTAEDFSNGTGMSPKFTDFQKLLKKCHIDPDASMDGIVLPACVPKSTEELLLNNYTQSGYAKYLNDSSYTGAGVGSQDDWVVVILSTNTTSGSFASGASMAAELGFVLHLLGLSLGLMGFMVK